MAPSYIDNPFSTASAPDHTEDCLDEYDNELVPDF